MDTFRFVGKDSNSPGGDCPAVIEVDNPATNYTNSEEAGVIVVGATLTDSETAAAQQLLAAHSSGLSSSEGILFLPDNLVRLIQEMPRR